MLIIAPGDKRFNTSSVASGQQTKVDIAPIYLQNQQQRHIENCLGSCHVVTVQLHKTV